ncbi:GNAT family N-acetyltransferase [Maritimibacter sp. UBA3975]|uniref:GNAT family N-acetyltransferase n=1 Tax=Maritimibacter sp. UBA3975 TaxID=1946833 RepID=UPI000C0B38E8|nr:GNAT family N-acetyltransferase [Maritimibacter sp. UBA3975]MAM62661.1 GNAT family N-acetyltransferase [Maritimibacter sp.]|tara:strand:- start:2850 stop:3389 length:540 start_codon:yes stop_codon:yes gene_type:complete
MRLNCYAGETATPPPFTLRGAGADDAEALGALLAASYARLLAPDYPPAVLDAALPRITMAQPELLAAPGYLVAEAGGGEIVAAGGWTWRGPAGGAAPLDWAHVRHVAVHPDLAGAGLGRLIVTQAADTAREAGVRVLSCLSTLTARGFYRRMGFADLGEVELSLAPGVGFPAVQMRKVL